MFGFCEFLCGVVWSYCVIAVILVFSSVATGVLFHLAGLCGNTSLNPENCALCLSIPEVGEAGKHGKARKQEATGKRESRKRRKSGKAGSDGKARKQEATQKARKRESVKARMATKQNDRKGGKQSERKNDNFSIFSVCFVF